jgi:hypothetical protein
VVVKACFLYILYLCIYARTLKHIQIWKPRHELTVIIPYKSNINSYRRVRIQHHKTVSNNINNQKKRRVCVVRLCNFTCSNGCGCCYCHGYGRYHGYRCYRCYFRLSSYQRIAESCS